MSGSSPTSSCVILVPVGGGGIDPGCEMPLREVERRGYAVWRVRDGAAIDAARNRMAATALARGFEELLWIDPDVVFDPDAVERLRGHGQLLVCGLCPEPSRRGFAATFLPGLAAVRVGSSGGLLEVRSAGLGFALTRRAAFEAVAEHWKLPSCDDPLGFAIRPYFAPMAVRDGERFRYLGEGDSFCERARACRIPVLADTTQRLWRVGPYRYGWEDLGQEPQRFADYTLSLTVPSSEKTSEKTAAATPERST